VHDGVIAKARWEVEQPQQQQQQVGFNATTLQTGISLKERPVKRNKS
jgi:hypothetical protein